MAEKKITPKAAKSAESKSSAAGVTKTSQRLLKKTTAKTTAKQLGGS